MTRTVRQLEERLARLPDEAVVTRVAVSPSDPHRVLLDVGGRPLVELLADDVARLEIVEGCPWDDAVAAGVRDAVAMEAARREAVRALARRGLSRRELVTLLERKGHATDAAERVAAALDARGIIDDEVLAESVCRRTVRAAPAAPPLLEQRLRQRGIDDETARRAADGALAGVDLLEEAVRLGRRSLSDASRLTRQAAIRRVAGALARRGFDEDTVLQALRRLDLDPDAPS